MLVNSINPRTNTRLPYSSRQVFWAAARRLSLIHIFFCLGADREFTVPQSKTPADQELVELFQQKNIPYLIAYNKSDLAAAPALGDRELAVSAQTKEGIEELKERIARLVKTGEASRRLVGDLSLIHI